MNALYVEREKLMNKEAAEFFKLIDNSWVVSSFKDIHKGDLFITSNDEFESVWEATSEVYLNGDGIRTVDADNKGKNEQN